MRGRIVMLMALAVCLANAPTGAGATTPDDLYAQADALLKEGQSDAAAGKLSEAIAIDPSHWPSHCRLGEIYLASRRYSEAEQALRTAVRINPTSGACMSRLAQVLLMAEQLEEAERVLNRARELLPSDEAVTFNLGRLDQTTGRPEKALEGYLKYLELAGSGPRSAPIRLKLARVLAQLGRPSDGVEHYRAFLQDQPSRHDARLEMAAQLASASRYDEALKEYDTVIAAGAAGAAGLAGAASARLQLGDLPGAIEYYERAVAEAPKDIPARVGLATALARAESHERAVVVLEGVTADDPKNNRAFFLLSQSLTKLGRAAEAREALERHRSIHEEILRRRMSDRPTSHQ